MDSSCEVNTFWQGRERVIVDQCRQQITKYIRLSGGGRAAAGGVAVDLYQFKDTSSADVKRGNFFQTTSMDRFDHDPVIGIALKGANKGSECMFWIHDLN